MASMRLGRKWLKRTKRTRLPRLDTIPRRADVDESEDDPGTKIVVDLNEDRTAPSRD